MNQFRNPTLTFVYFIAIHDFINWYCCSIYYFNDFVSYYCCSRWLCVNLMTLSAITIVAGDFVLLLWLCQLRLLKHVMWLCVNFMTLSVNPVEAGVTYISKLVHSALLPGCYVQLYSWTPDSIFKLMFFSHI